MTRSHDYAEKVAMVRGLLAEHPEADALVVTQQEVLSWLLDGARVAIALGGPPILAVRVTPDEATVHCYANEADRIGEEELAVPLPLEVVPWHASVAEAAGAGSDRALVDVAVADALRDLRRTLLPAERARYELLCAEVARALTDVALATVPSDTERSVAARLGGALAALGADPLVLLVAGEERVGHRHPLATSIPVGRRLMIVACARRHGMIANITRWVRFAEPDAAERDRETRIMEVEADALDALRPGETLGAVLDVIQRSYGRHGFAADEWTRHHQGGPAGYLGRDPRAVPGSTVRIADGQAFTWNPSVPGDKVEDTVLLDDGRIRVLTVDPRWPVRAVRGRDRPTALVL